MSQLSIQCTLEPSDYIRNLYKRTYTCEPSNTPEEYTKSILYVVLLSDGVERGVVGFSQVSGKLWNAHISAERPILGKSLISICHHIMAQVKECGIMDSILCCPQSTLSERLAQRLGFSQINTTPLIYFRAL